MEQRSRDGWVEPSAERLAAEAIPSPNIWDDPDGYELENAGVDPDGALEATMLRLAGRDPERGWDGLTVLDVGCGSGYHLPGFAASADHVVGAEPHRPLAIRARERLAQQGIDNATVVQAGAQALPLADGSVDVLHARWAYFFGAGCEPGLAEVARVLRPGSTAFVIDNDATRSTFGEWFRRAWPTYDPAAVERFWRRQGWSREQVDIRWSHRTRADLERVVRLEFTPHMSDWILARHDGTEVDYAVNVWWRRG
ncbi:class I SAM-dependent methyltransferase [Arsenicicoccus sp. oral taxon 190]|uniref:class I SAM-dependent methyltransferase n=1 Tax=Arsenicicoccus sp. oral taxon 190 TaxID=1658671 RepID=UPI00067A2CA1|nr:class I SAM-dependent methyltransferase [Arsenicicoccus sp. oral taxon 190]AKT52655.1 methyltransferase type 11 [Arsenicicoccus sp. oral taxon 190]